MRHQLLILLAMSCFAGSAYAQANLEGPDKPDGPSPAEIDLQQSDSEEVLPPIAGQGTPSSSSVTDTMTATWESSEPRDSWNMLDTPAQRREIRLELGSRLLHVNDGGWDLFEDDDLRKSRNFVVRAQARVVAGFSVGASYVSEDTSRRAIGILDTEFATRGFDVRARYDLEPLPFVRPYVAADIGARFSEATMRFSDARAQDRASALAWGAYGGLELLIPTRYVSVGFYQEYGLQWQGERSFDNMSFGGTEEGEIPIESIDAGTLALRGFAYSLGAFAAVHF